jgi:hypothetical protein
VAVGSSLDDQCSMVGSAILSELAVQYSRLIRPERRPHTPISPGALSLRSLTALRAAADASSLEQKLPRHRFPPAHTSPVDGLIRPPLHIDNLTVDARTEYLGGQHPNDYLGELGYQDYFVNDGGNKICCYFWPAAGQPKGVILLSHGMGSYLCFEYLLSQVRQLNT